MVEIVKANECTLYSMLDKAYGVCKRDIEFVGIAAYDVKRVYVINEERKIYIECTSVGDIKDTISTQITGPVNLSESFVNN